MVSPRKNGEKQISNKIPVHKKNYPLTIFVCNVHSVYKNLNMMTVH